MATDISHIIVIEQELHWVSVDEHLKTDEQRESHKEAAEAIHRLRKSFEQTADTDS